MSNSIETLGNKLYKLLKFLRQVPGHKALTPTEIYDACTIDIQDEDMLAALAVHHRVEVREDKANNINKYAYKPIYKVKCEDDLLTILANQGSKGIRKADVDDGGEETEEIVRAMILKGK